MVRLIRFLLGYVCFTFQKGFTDGFINACYVHGVRVHNLKKDGAQLTGECLAKTYPSLHRLAREQGGVLQITKKRGIIFPLLKLRGRWGLFVGAVLFAAILCYLGGFIWNVEIEGNRRIPETAVVSFLEENGLSRGVRWQSVDKDRCENLMMASFEDCAWVHINQEGTTARVQLSETRPKPSVVQHGVYNLKAKKDGLIVKATVYDGWAVAHKGDSVTKGDLLISGIYESEKKKGNQFAHARGEYLAEVTEPFSLTVSRSRTQKVYTAEKTCRMLLFFGIRLPLTLTRMPKTNCDITRDVSFVRLRGALLPIGCETVTARCYVQKTITLSDRELLSLCRRETERKIQKEYSSVQILSRDIRFSLEENCAKATGRLLCTEDIGEEVKINIRHRKE